MARSKELVCLIVAVAGLLCGGCAPGKTTVQPVHLRLTRADSGRVVKDAVVALEYDYDENVSPEFRFPEGMKVHYPWFGGVTNEEGEATVLLKFGMLDRSLGATPPAGTDRVSGKVYLVRVQTNGEEAVQRAMMKAGATVPVDGFAVKIVEIDKPYYVPTN